MPIAPLYLTSAIIEPACHAWSNIFDNLLSERFKGHFSFLICTSNIIQALLILPLLFLFPISFFLPLPLMGLILLVAILDCLYVYPYYKALAHTDTSIVVALFSLGKIILPVLAWIFLDEHLTFWQYVGFGVIITSSLMLTFNWKRFHFNKAALLMLISSLLLSAVAIISKYTLNHGVSWQQLAAGSMLLQGLMSIAFLATRPRQTYALCRRLPLRIKTLFLAEGLITMVGNAGYIMALSLLPLSIVKAIGSTQPLFVMAYAKVLHPVWPGTFKEDHVKINPLWKLAGLLLTILGTILAAGYLE